MAITGNLTPDQLKVLNVRFFKKKKIKVTHLYLVCSWPVQNDF